MVTYFCHQLALRVSPHLTRASDGISSSCQALWQALLQPYLGTFPLDSRRALLFWFCCFSLPFVSFLFLFAGLLYGRLMSGWGCQWLSNYGVRHLPQRTKTTKSLEMGRERLGDTVLSSRSSCAWRNILFTGTNRFFLELESQFPWSPFDKER